MIARTWTAKFEPASLNALQEFAMVRSLPYLRAQPGNLGVLYLAHGTTWQTVTLWRSRENYAAMEIRRDYRALSSAIAESGTVSEFLSVDVSDVMGFDFMIK